VAFLLIEENLEKEGLEKWFIINLLICKQEFLLNIS